MATVRSRYNSAFSVEASGFSLQIFSSRSAALPVVLRLVSLIEIIAKLYDLLSYSTTPYFHYTLIIL